MRLVALTVTGGVSFQSRAIPPCSPFAQYSRKGQINITTISNLFKYNEKRALAAKATLCDDSAFHCVSPPVPTATLKRQGRPRSQESHEAILEAAAALAKHMDYAELSIELIAQQAGVSKATIYRWWPNKLALMIEVLSDAAQKLPEPIYGSDDLRLHLFKCLKGGCRFLFSSELTPILRGALADCKNDSDLLNQLNDAFFSRLQNIGLRDLTKVLEQGRNAADTNPEALLEQLWGPLYYRFLIANKPVDDDYLYGLLDNLACLRQ